MAQHYNERTFIRQVDAAMATVKRLLNNARTPELPTEVSHSYEDKFALAESLTNTALAAVTNVLADVGLGAERLATLRQWCTDGHDVTLRLETAEKCAYLREATRTVESPKTTEVTKKSGKGEKTKTTSVITEITEHFWSYSVTTKLVAYKGAAPDGTAITAFSSGGSAEIMTKVKQQPRMVHRMMSPATDTPVEAWKPLRVQEVSLTWLLKLLKPGLELRFRIDRAAGPCKTPRRNEDVEAVLDGLQALHDFAEGCRLIAQEWLNVGLGGDQYRTLAPQLNESSIFVPVVALFETQTDEAAATAAAPAADDAEAVVKINQLHAGESSVVLKLGDVNVFLAEHRRSIAAKRAELGELPAEGLWTAAIAAWSAVLGNLLAIVRQYGLAVAYIEHMLEQQLYSAIGRDIDPQSFDQFMRVHQQRLYTDEFAPKPFAYAVRRPGCFPEGIVSIESPAMSGSPAAPISTIVRNVAAGPDMTVKLNASCSITLKGERYLHAYLAQSFGGGGSGTRLALVARARQFSAFILMLGKLGGAASFQPMHAIVIKDKDDLAIPLMLEALPSAQEFKDAIESLSPEQQEFAKAYRAMQLEGTVFGLAVIQLKPQLERLLNLPAGSLTKEIQLSRDLQTLFIEHQIPSDLLTYEGNADTPVATKLDSVKGHVAAINDMIAAEKKAEQEAAKQAYETNHPEVNLSASDDLGGSGFGISMHSKSARSKSARSKGPTPRGGGSVAAYCDLSVSPAPIYRMARAAACQPPPLANRLSKPLSSNPRAADAPPQYEAPPADTDADADADGAATLDFTQIPAALDKQFEALDTDGALRPTKINVLDDWMLESRKGLLGKPLKERLNEGSKKSHKDKAFDLLDAISRSGSLAIEDCCSVHIMVAVTHQFEKSVVNTVVQNNVNPINMVERSSLIIAATVHGTAVEQLVRPQQLARIAGHSIQLITAPAPAQAPAATVHHAKKKDYVTHF